MTTDDAKRRLSSWYLQWRLPLRRFLLGKAGVRSTDVDDVAQEVFLRLMRYERGELVAHPKAYLYKIAFNVAAEWSIRAASRSPHDEKWLANLTGGAEPDAVLQRVQSQAEIKRALSTLPVEQREVLKLHFSEELGQNDIALRTGRSRRRIRRDVARAYERLRLELDPEALENDGQGALQNGEPHERE
jgi:RNA polymerase sigma factor (sigma-70 family)